MRPAPIGAGNQALAAEKSRRRAGFNEARTNWCGKQALSPLQLAQLNGFNEARTNWCGKHTAAKRMSALSATLQ